MRIIVLLVSSAVLLTFAYPAWAQKENLLTQLHDRDFDSIPDTIGDRINLSAVYHALAFGGCSVQDRAIAATINGTAYTRFFMQADPLLYVTQNFVRNPYYIETGVYAQKHGCNSQQVQQLFNNLVALLNERSNPAWKPPIRKQTVPFDAAHLGEAGKGIGATRAEGVATFLRGKGYEVTACFYYRKGTTDRVYFWAKYYPYELDSFPDAEAAQAVRMALGRVPRTECPLTLDEARTALNNSRAKQ